MKNIGLFILLISNLVWSQEAKFSGTIKDAQTLEPIAYVSIDINNENTNSTGSISNEDGVFELNTDYPEVTFNHIEYEPLTMPLTSKNHEILLQPKVYVIERVVISKTSPKDYLKHIIKLSKKKINKNTLLKSYCRETVKVNDTYTKFSDGLVNYYIKKGNGKANITLGQHRSMKKNEKHDFTDLTSAFKLKHYVRDAYNFKFLKKIINNDEYKLKRTLKKQANGSEYEYIKVIPNPSSKKVLYKGYVIVDKKTKNILEYKLYTSKEHLKNARLRNFIIAKAKINKGLFWSKFNLINNQPILTYHKKMVDLHITSGKKIDHDFNFMSDLFVYEFKNNVQIPRKGYRHNTIFESGTKFHSKFWKQFNTFPLSQKEIQFIQTAKTEK